MGSLIAFFVSVAMGFKPIATFANFIIWNM